VLGDFHLAEDAAQEAFLEAYRSLPSLSQPKAFPGWLRRIVLRRCSRLTRRKNLPTAPIEAAENVSSGEPDPAIVAQKADMKDKVIAAIKALPDNERMVTTLFYINGYSQNDIARFLEVPVTTVKNRLHTSRKQLKERMIAMVSDTLNSHRPGPEERRAIMDELLGRKARFDKHICETFKPDPKWAGWWHDRRILDVRANAAQYNMQPDEQLPRMLPEYQRSRTFRDDFKDVPRRWGIPSEVKLSFMREFCRDISVRPLALLRWEHEGLPVLRYFPWFAYDAQRVQPWVEERGVRADERMNDQQTREPLLLTLRTLASGEASVAECRRVVSGLETSTICAAGNEVDAGRISISGLDPCWAEAWVARRPEERKANARKYGLAEPAENEFGIPDEVLHARPVFEIRDLCRRLRVSPLDVVRWTKAGMPCLRCSPWVRWDIEQVAKWLSESGSPAPQEHSPQELDELDKFLLPLVASGEGTPEAAHEVFAGWVGLM